MDIKIEKSKDHYRADCLDLPGSPPVGLGRTPELAVACLFWRLMFEDTGGKDPHLWLSYLKKDEPILVNNEKWDWPKSYKDNSR